MHVLARMCIIVYHVWHHFLTHLMYLVDSAIYCLLIKNALLNLDFFHAKMMHSLFVCTRCIHEPFDDDVLKTIIVS